MCIPILFGRQYDKRTELTWQMKLGPHYETDSYVWKVLLVKELITNQVYCILFAFYRYYHIFLSKSLFIIGNLKL